MSRQPPTLPPLYGTPETRERFMAAHRHARAEAVRVVMRLCAELRRQPHEMPRTPRLWLREGCRLPVRQITINADWRDV